MTDTVPNANFDRIVVGVDGSRGSDLAVRWAHLMAGITGAEVLAVHGFEYVPMRGHETNELLLQQRAAELDGHWTVALRSNGVAYRTFIEAEDPRPLLTRIATEEKADVIVVSNRGHSQLAELFLGSTAEYLTHHAKIPVVVIPIDAAISSP